MGTDRPHPNGIGRQHADIVHGVGPPQLAVQHDVGHPQGIGESNAPGLEADQRVLVPQRAGHETEEHACDDQHDERFEKAHAGA
ncbi:MAG: hypothetical protein P8174_00010 [Gemmatimonadota bacterium]